MELAWRQDYEAVLTLTQLKVAQKMFTTIHCMGSITVETAHPAPRPPSTVLPLPGSCVYRSSSANTMLKLFTFVLPTAFHFNVSQPQKI